MASTDVPRWIAGPRPQDTLFGGTGVADHPKGMTRVTQAGGRRLPDAVDVTRRCTTYDRSSDELPKLSRRRRPGRMCGPSGQVAPWWCLLAVPDGCYRFCGESDRETPCRPA